MAVGFGGYVSLPVYLAARLAGVPLVIHEGNAVPGLANRVAARFTPHVVTTFPETRLPHARHLGLPVREQIAGLDRAARRPAARQDFGLPAAGPVLLVSGGSQGARSLNLATADAVPRLLAAGISVLHVLGSANLTADIVERSPTRLPEPPTGRCGYVERHGGGLRRSRPDARHGPAQER